MQHTINLPCLTSAREIRGSQQRASQAPDIRCESLTVLPTRPAVRPSRMKIFAVVLLPLLLLTTALQSVAQTDYGRITVLVCVSKSDPCEPVSNIEVNLLAEQGSIRARVTGEDGRSVFAMLDPGSYEIRINASSTTVRLLPGQSFTLRVQARRPGVTTFAQAPTGTSRTQISMPPVDADKLVDRITPGRKGEGATTSQLEELPNRNQNEAPLLDTQPGVFNSDNDAFAGFLFNGQPGNQNVTREGGINSNVIVRSAASFQDTNALFVAVKDRQSIKKYSSFGLDTSNTPADFGTGTGGQLVQNIKSGGKKWTRELYEYNANDAFSARNFFDFARKPSLRFNLFGFSLSGPLYDREGFFPHIFAYANYEGIRASAGNTIFAAAPKLSLAPRAVPATASLLSSFRAPGANIISGSSDPDFDILQLDARNLARRDSVTTRFDFQLNKLDKMGFIYLGSRSKEDVPDGLSGRRNVSLDLNHRAIFNYQRALTKNAEGDAKLTNQFIFAVINEPARVFARYDGGGNPYLSGSAVSIGGEIAHAGIPELSKPVSITTSGGLLRGDFEGRNSRLSPWQFSFVDQLVWTGKDHAFIAGGELRLLRTNVEQLFGTSYNFATLADFLANRASVDYSGDLGSFTGNVGSRHMAQEYYIGYAQDAWKVRSNFLFTYGVRYEYYSVLREQNARTINLDLETGALRPETEPFYKSRKTNILPRISFAWAPNLNGNLAEIKNGHTVISGSFGMHVGPDVFDNILRPITSDRLRVSGKGLAFPTDTAALVAATNLQDSAFKPLVLARDYTSPALVYKFDFTVKRDLLNREIQSSTDNDDKDVVKEMFVTFSYVGARSRNLMLRNFGNRIISVETNPDPTQPARVRREFDIDLGNGQFLHPYGELEYLTTGGRSSYDSFQTSFKGRLKNYLRLFQADYTLAWNRGNTDGADAIAAGNPLDYDYDLGYSAGDTRQKLGITALLALGCHNTKVCADSHNRLVKEILGGWTFAALGTFQTGPPIDVRLKRPDVVYIDQSGSVFGSPAVGRHAVLNVPSGGSSVAAYRPDLLAGANPYLNDDRSLLDPAAFSIPAPGVLGTLRRGALRGPGVSIVDLSVRKELAFGEEGSKSLTFNVDITNLFNHPNFKIPSTKLEPVLGTDATSNQLQPGQPFTTAAANTFGMLTRTFKRKSDLGASRQFQFGVSLKF